MLKGIGVLYLVIVCLATLAASSTICADERSVIRLPLSAKPVAVDGGVSPEKYGDAVILDGAFKTWGLPNPLNPSPMVYLKRTSDRLYIAYDSPLPEGERPLMKGAIPDNGGICADNAMEIYILPKLKPGSLVSYIQVAGNPRGCIYDTWITPQIGISDVAGFTAPWQFKNRLVPGHWYSELSATFEQMRFWSAKNGDTFDMDFCRDGGFGSQGASGYMCTFGGIQSGGGVQIVLDDDAPVVQWLSFGDFPNNKFNPKLRMKSSGKAGKYTVTVIASDPAADPITGKHKELYSKSTTVELSPGGSKDCGFSFDLQPASKGIASYRIVDEAGTVVFYRTIEFSTGNPYRHYQPQKEVKPLVVKAQMAPSYGRILASVDVIDFPGDKSNLEVQATAYRDGKSDPIGKVSITKFPYDYGQGIIDVDELTEGGYIVKFQAMDKNTKQPIGGEESVKLVRKIYEWENNKIGYSDAPPPPYTEVERFGNKGLCWGREYTFNGLAFPVSIKTLQPEPTRGAKIRDVLAGPVKLVAVSNGKQLEWNVDDEPNYSNQSTANYVYCDGKADTQGIIANVEGTLEYDGLYKIKLSLTPAGDRVKFDSIRVEVPMPTEIARLFNHSAESMRTNKTFANFDGMKDGVIWNSKDAAHNNLVKGNFLPITWMGDDDRGIAWMCDNDKSWVTDLNKPCLDVVRTGNVTTFRMHLLNKPGVLTKPIDVTFSLQATPIKPRPEGGSWKNVKSYGWSQFDKPLIWDKCFDDYEKGTGYKWFVNDYAKEHSLWWRYFCFNSDRISEDDPTYGQMVKDFAAEWYVDAPLAFVQNPLHTDFILWAYKKWHDKTGLSGSYHDNTFAVAWPGLINNTGWIDDEGNMRAGYWVFAYREFAKRERTYWMSVTKSPVSMAHITDAPVPGYLGFADIWLDGENGGYPDSSVKDPDFVDRWYNRTGMANLRITMGRQWGVCPSYLYTWGHDATQTVMGMFDIDKTPSRITDLPFTFGTDQADCRFMPFWDIKAPARVTSACPDVLVGTWSSPHRARIQVSNCGGGDRIVNVALNTQLLGLPANAVAIDDQTGEPVAYANGTVKNLLVGRHNYRAILIASPGTFTPVASASPSLVQGKRIERLCSDFSTLDGWKVLGTNVSSWNNRLRIQGPPYGLVSKPFGEDNCSVTIKVTNGTGTKWTNRYWDAYPSIMLYWKKGTYAGIAAGYGVPEPNGHFNQSFAFSDGKQVGSSMGPKAGVVNWLKITLKPTTIEYYSSTDGKTWTLINTMPRTGFEGTPAYLYIGRGTVAGPDELVQGDDRGDGQAYFDDLVTVGNR